MRAKEPAGRIATAREVRERLSPFLPVKPRETTDAVKPASSTSSEARTPVHNFWQTAFWSLAALVLAMLLLAGIVLLLLWLERLVI